MPEVIWGQCRMHPSSSRPDEVALRIDASLSEGGVPISILQSFHGTSKESRLWAEDSHCCYGIYALGFV